MSKPWGLIATIMGGLVGLYLYRYPAQIIDFVFGNDPEQWRPIRFFKIFGIVIMCLAGLSFVVVVLAAMLGTA
jgi:hypothetical protein